MYTYIGIALLTVAAIMMIPALPEQEASSSVFWGIANVKVLDANGNEVMRQQVHNNLMDEGEDYLVTQTFNEGTTDDTDDNQISSICLSKDTTFNGFTPTAPTETEGASTFDTDDLFSTEASCFIDAAADLATTGAPKLGPLTFDYATHVGNTGTHIITNIGICQGDGSVGASTSVGCQAAQGGNTGILFAQIDIADFTLATAGEQAQIDYTFDIDADDN